MKLWRRASGALKDKNSLWIAAITGRSKNSHPDLEVAVIKATSHDESFVDYKNTQRVFAFVRTSPVHLLSFMRALSRRMQRTRNSIVAIKGLMLLHGVLCTKIPATCTIGRLPFDLSNFNSSSDDSSSRHGGFNAFIRSYFSFLDQKSAFLSKEFQEIEDLKKIKRSGCDEYDGDEDGNVKLKEESLIPTLKRLQKWQALLDILLHVQPRGKGMNNVVILEAMDCVIIEVFDTYSKICDGIANVLMRVYASAGKVEAALALEVLLRATRQGDQLAHYFELCREIGLLDATECPKVERIPEEDIQELERIIYGVVEEEKAIVVSEERTVSVMDGAPKGHKKDLSSSCSSMMTVITHEWELFEDDMKEDQKTRKGDNGMIMDIGDLIDLSDEGEKTTTSSTITTAISPPYSCNHHQYYMLNVNEIIKFGVSR
ncbi:hypothetical protein Ancab_027631 [Ancistrocladus abbreviatus]